MNVLDYHIRRTKTDRSACNNTDTSFNVIADMTKDEDILSYTDDKGVVHCFEAKEVDDLLTRRTNYYTNQNLPKTFVKELKSYRKSESYTRSIAIANRTIVPIDETKRKIDEIDELLHNRGLSDNSGGDAYITVDQFLKGDKRYWPWNYRSLDGKAVVNNMYNNRNTKVKDWYLVYVVIKYASDQEKIHSEATSDDDKELANEYTVQYRRVIDKFFPEIDVNKMVIETCKNGRIAKLDKLVNRFSLTIDDIRANDNQALRTVSTSGHVNVLNYLKEKFGLTANDARANNNELIRLSSANGYIDVLEYLKEKFGLTINDVRTDDNGALRFAAMNDHVDTVEYLKEEFGLTANDARSDNNDALRWVSVGGHVDVLRYLREGFGLTADDARVYNNYALRMAARNGHVDILRYLREGFGLNAKDARSSNNAAFKMAAKKGHLDVLKYLREGYGLTLKDIRSDNNEALRYATRKGRVGVIRYLKEDLSV